MWYATLFLSTYPSFCSFRSSCTLLFSPCIAQVYQCVQIRTNGKLTGNGTFFYLECLNMCKLRYSQFHATLVLLSFAKFLGSAFSLCLVLTVVCYTLFIRVTTIFSCTFESKVHKNSNKKKKRS